MGRQEALDSGRPRAPGWGTISPMGLRKRPMLLETLGVRLADRPRVRPILPGLSEPKSA